MLLTVLLHNYYIESKVHEQVLVKTNFDNDYKYNTDYNYKYNLVCNYFLNPNIRSRKRSHLSSRMFFQNTRGSTDHAWCLHYMLIDIELIRFRLLQHQDRVSTKQTHQSDTFMLMRTIAPSITGCVIEANDAVVFGLHLAA